MRQPTSLERSCLIDCMVGSALDGMCVGLVILTESGKLSWLNRAAEDLLGVKRGEVTGELFTHVLRDPQFSAFWHEASQAEGNAMGEVTTHWPRHGELKVNASYCRSSDGEVLGRAVLFCDVTAERTVAVNLSEELTRRFLELTHDSTSAPRAPQEGLTAQELRILGHVGEGMSNAEIGEAMFISTSTVRSHLKHLYAKLDLGSRAEAIRYAIQNGLTG